MFRLAITLAFTAITFSVQATSYIPLGDSDLLDQANTVITGQVISSAVTLENDRPYTKIRFSVEEVIKGTIITTEITVRQLGGVHSSGKGLKIWSAPEFNQGDRHLLFLSQRSDGDYAISHFMLGAFREQVAAGRLVYVQDLTDALEVSSDGKSRPGAISLRDKQAFLEWLRLQNSGLRTQPTYLKSSSNSGDQGKVSEEFTNINNPPVRWFEFDAGQQVPWVADSTPEAAMGAASFTAFSVALQAWNADAGSNIDLRDDGQAVARTGFNGSDNVNAILFNDPHSEIPGSFICGVGGTLAIGGPGFATTFQQYKGEDYHPAVEGDVVTQNGAGCFFVGNANKNGEEVFAHEIGHALGLGHSADDSALMRPDAHGDGRGAQLGNDDRAAVAKFYEETAAATQDIDVNPALLDFGNVQSGNNAAQNVTINNVGNAALNIASISVSGADAASFVQNGVCDAQTITAGAECVFQITFTASDLPGKKSANIAITSNDPDEATVHISISAFVTAVPDININPTSLDFGEVNVSGGESSLSVNVANTGNGQLVITQVELSGQDSSQFSVKGCVAANLQNGQSCDVSVTFSPIGALGNRSASLNISSNDADEPISTIALSGEAQSDQASGGSSGGGCVMSEINGSRDFSLLILMLFALSVLSLQRFNLHSKNRTDV